MYENALDFYYSSTVLATVATIQSTVHLVKLRGVFMMV